MIARAMTLLSHARRLSEAPWVLRASAASCFAAAVFFNLRFHHTSFGAPDDGLRAAMAAPVFAGIVWTLARVEQREVRPPRAALLTPRRAPLLAVGAALAWVAIWSAGRALVALAVGGPWSVLAAAALAITALAAIAALDGLYARVRLRGSSTG
jgi:hypothetical protein